MTTPLNVPWVLVGKEPFLATCTICERTLVKPPLPIEVDALLGVMREFLREHRGCYRASKLGVPA